MKTSLQIKVLFSVIILVIGTGSIIIAQTNWIKYEGNPVLEGSSGSWYEEIDVVRVIYEENMFKMWFSGSEYSYIQPHHIGYAESVDGLEWDVRCA
jgi:hypothetical protein